MQREQNVSEKIHSVGEDALINGARVSALASEDGKRKKDGFAKLKRRANAMRLVRSLLLGFTSAWLTCALVLSIVRFFPLYEDQYQLIDLLYTFLPSLIGQAVGLAVGFCVWFILRRNDKVLAKRFDSQFDFKEGMQTSLEYKDDTGAMASLLRDSMKEKTEAVNTKEIKIKALPAYIVAAVISFVLCVVMLFMPYNIIERPGDKVEPFELSEIQIAQIEAIILRVESSEMEEGARAEVATELKALLDVLKITKEKDTALELISLSVLKIDDITEKTGTSYDLYDTLVTGDTIFTRDVGRLLTLHDWEKFKIKRERMRAYFEHAEYGSENADIEKINTETIGIIKDSALSLKNQLAKSGIDENDALYSELTKLAIGLDSIASDLENGLINYRAAVGTSEQGEIFFLLGDKIYQELDKQNKNYSVGFGASDEIRKMFGLPLVNREDNRIENKPTDVDDPDNKDEEGNHGGGYGDGDVFGSNDAIYDRDENAHIKYGQVLDAYYQIMTNSNYTEEEKKAIQSYFEILYRGLEEEKGE